MATFVLDGDWGPSYPSPKGHSPPPIFGPYPLRQNGCIYQDSISYRGIGLGPGRVAPPSQQKPKFSAHVYCGQTAGWIKMLLGMEVGLSPGDLVVLDGDPSPLQKGGGTPQIFGLCLLWPNGWMDQMVLGMGRPQPI